MGVEEFIEGYQRFKTIHETFVFQNGTYVNNEVTLNLEKALLLKKEVTF